MANAPDHTSQLDVHGCSVELDRQPMLPHRNTRAHRIFDELLIRHMIDRKLWWPPPAHQHSSTHSRPPAPKRSAQQHAPSSSLVVGCFPETCLDASTLALHADVEQEADGPNQSSDPCSSGWPMDEQPETLEPDDLGDQFPRSWRCS